MKKKALRLAIVLSALAYAPALHAQALITFGAPVNIATDTDVSTAGTFVSAFHASSTTPVTVNGVTFAGTTTSSFTTAMTFGTGAGSLTFTPGTGDAFNGYANAAGNTPSGSAAYNSLISSAFYFRTTETLTFNNLTIGQAYQFQYFNQDLGNSTGRVTTLSDLGTTANTVSLGNNPGQYVLGTFTASGTTENIGLSVSNLGYFNAIELRAVPEPSTYALMFGGLGVLAVVWRRKAAGSI